MAIAASLYPLHSLSSFLPSPHSRTLLRWPGLSLSSPLQRLHRRGNHHHLTCLAMATDFLGDFGARDPFSEEIASNFGEKVLGPPDTEHRILIPNISALSLSQLSCDHVPPSQPPMPVEEAKKLLRKVVGWRLVEEEGAPTRLQCLWKVRDHDCGVELVNRINKVAEAAGHFPSLHLKHPNQVKAELWTPSIGGLSMNDFIMASKIDEIKILDLIPKKRVWA